MTMTRLRHGLPQQLVALTGRTLRSRLGILVSPARDMREAQRTATIGLPPEAVTGSAPPAAGRSGLR
jgi:hypothetical protein